MMADASQKNMIIHYADTTVIYDIKWIVLRDIHITMQWLNKLYKGRSEPISFFAIMMTSSNGNIFRVTGPLCGVFTGHRWIPRTKASDAELWCFFDLRLNKRLSVRILSCVQTWCFPPYVLKWYAWLVWTTAKFKLDKTGHRSNTNWYLCFYFRSISILFEHLPRQSQSNDIHKVFSQ